MFVFLVLLPGEEEMLAITSLCLRDFGLALWLLLLITNTIKGGAFALQCGPEIAQVLALSLATCVNMGKFPNCSNPQFFHLENRHTDDSSSY